MERPSLYRDIHKAIRLMLGALVERAGTTDFSDVAAVATLRTATIDAFAALESHGAHEDHWIGPELRRHAPDLERELAEAHVEQHEQIRKLIALLVEEERSGVVGWTRGQAFAVALSRFVGEFYAHMADEEEKAMTALWAAMTDEEIQALSAALRADVSPSEMAKWMRWMIPAMRHRDRVEMARGAKAAMPPEAFAGLVALARTVLEPHESDALERAIGIARAA